MLAAIRLRTAPAARRALCAAAGPEFAVERLAGDDAGVAVMTMDRPRAKNALGRTMMEQFRAALDDVRFDPAVRVVLVRSAVPGVFCAGADLKERATMDAQEVSSFVHSLRAGFQALEQLPMPTIAVVEGAALGGGLEMAMSCDFRVAAPAALVGVPETSLAIIPGAGGSQRLPRLVGVSKAKELMFTARRIQAEAAADIGLVDYVDEDALGRAMALAREITPNGPVAVRMAKQAVNVGMQADLATAMKIEEACYAQVIPTADRVEGLTAFREKRKPVYVGA